MERNQISLGILVVLFSVGILSALFRPSDKVGTLPIRQEIEKIVFFYAVDQDGADGAYKGKDVSFRGNAKTVSKLYLHTIVDFEESYSGITIAGTFKNSHGLTSSIFKDQSINVTCKIKGRILDKVLADCTILSNHGGTS